MYRGLAALCTFLDQGPALGTFLDCYTLCIFNRRSGIKNGLKHGRGSLSIISPPPSRFSASQPGNLLVFLLTLLDLLGSGGEAASGPGLGGAVAGPQNTKEVSIKDR